MDLHGKHLSDVGDVCDDQDFLKIRLNRFDRFHQALSARVILGAEAFIDYQCLEPGAGSSGQQAREGNANGKIYFEGFAAAEQLVVARAYLITNENIESFR